MATSILRAAVCALAALTGGAPLVAQTPAYHLEETIPVGGAGIWDYLAVDTAGRHLFVAHDSQVEVVDLLLDTLTAVIPNTPGVHGIAIADDLGLGFASDGRDSTVTVFDLRTLTTVDTVSVSAGDPDAIVYDPVSRRVFTMNGGNGTATGFDGASGDVAGTVPLGGRPEFAVADGRGRIYVNLEDSSAVVAFDTRSLRVLRRWSLAPCERPSGLAMDREHGRLFSTCGNRLMAVSDVEGGRMVATVPIGAGVDAAAFDPVTGLVFASCGADAVLTIIHEDDPDHYRVVADVPTLPGARTMALDPLSHRVFLATARFGPTPAPTPGQPRPRPPIVPGSFVVLVVAP